MGKHEAITEKIIEIFYKSYNTPGYGFLEKVDEKAMIVEFNKLGLWNIKQCNRSFWLNYSG